MRQGCAKSVAILRDVARLSRMSQPITHMNRRLASFGLVALAVIPAAATSFGLSRWPFRTPREAAGSRVNLIFARWTDSTPGCAVAAEADGAVVLSKGYGMADLEHDVKITPDTIFEAGSVSKQFTAAAVLMLAHEGKLALDDPARKYIPELPERGR